MNTVSMRTPLTLAQENARFMSSVYRWMTAGILTTALVATYIGGNRDLLIEIARNRPLFWVLVIVQLGAVFGLSAAIHRLSVFAAALIYFGYAALTGVTLSTIFLIYTHESIGSVFVTTAVAFAGLSAFGYVTKRDLGPIGSFCGMALFGLIGWGLLAFFFPSLMGGSAQLVYSVAGVLIFSGLTAYDTQKIKALNTGDTYGDTERKEAIFGALMLYLDFINLFMELLYLMGDRRE